MKKGVFEIEPPISGVNFSNNMLISQVRVNRRETEYEITFETLKFYRILRALSSSEYPTIVGDLQIYSVQFTEKCVSSHAILICDFQHPVPTHFFSYEKLNFSKIEIYCNFIFLGYQKLNLIVAHTSYLSKFS